MVRSLKSLLFWSDVTVTCFNLSLLFLYLSITNKNRLYYIFLSFVQVNVWLISRSIYFHRKNSLFELWKLNA